jgi:hypothetical protein
MTYKIVNLQKWARQYVLDPNSQNRGSNSRAPSTGGHINPYDEVFPGIYLGDRYLLIRQGNVSWVASVCRKLFIANSRAYIFSCKSFQISFS